MKLNITQKTQKGVALITALLIVALATIIAVSMASRQQIDIYRTANLINSEQAYQYALGGENWVKRILVRDAKQNNIDSAKDIWATPIAGLPIPGGTLQGKVEDLQSRFNLNNLINPETGKANNKEVQFFERLLKNLELSPTLVPVVLDWIDSDSETRLNGAEDNTYLIKTPPYRTANTFFSTPSELRLLAGFDAKTYEKLLPYITTLPTNTPININTAPPQILMSLSEDLTDVTELITTRTEKPFESTSELKINTNNVNISVSSSYFMLTAEVYIDRGKAQLQSIFHRLPNKISVIMRNQGG